MMDRTPKTAELVSDLRAFQRDWWIDRPWLTPSNSAYPLLVAADRLEAAEKELIVWRSWANSDSPMAMMDKMGVKVNAADVVIETARVALAEVAADNDSEYGCSHADAAQQALDLIAGWKGPAATAGEMNPPASKAGLELAEQVLHYALFVGPGDMTIGEVVTMIERLFGPAVADALKDRHRPRETP